MGILDMETCYDDVSILMTDLHMMSLEPTLMSEVFCERPKQKAIMEWHRRKAYTQNTSSNKKVFDTLSGYQRQRAATQPMPRKKPDALHKSSSDRPLRAQSSVMELSSLRHVVSSGGGSRNVPSGIELGKPMVELSLDHSNQVLMLEDLCIKTTSTMNTETDCISLNQKEEETLHVYDDDNEEDESSWGWFEEFDEPEEEPAFHDYVYSTPPVFKNSSQNQMIMASSCSTVSTFSCTGGIRMMKKIVPTAQELCKTFSPLHLGIETAYTKSPFQWMHIFSSTSHLVAKIQIRSFRIVEKNINHTITFVRHAEYFVELQLNGYAFNRWIRFSALRRFMKNLDRRIFHQTHASWRRVESITRWFDRLEVDYLHQRCKFLEAFAQTLLYESTTAHTLAELMEAF
jgi:hypothetical protein